MGRVLLICIVHVPLCNLKKRGRSVLWVQRCCYPFRGSGPAVSDIYLLLALFDTTSRAVGGKTEPRLAPRSGNLTPPRISPSCPHCVISKMRLWLGRGTIVGERGHCKTACQCCFWMDGNRWAPYLAVFYSRKKIHCNSLLLQVVLAHPPHRLSFSEARPLMLFSRRI